MKTHNQVISVFEQIADQHEQIKSFGYGDLWEVVEKEGFDQFEYPRLWVLDAPSSINGTDHFMNFRYLVMDIPKQGEGDELEILSDTKSIALDVIKLLKDIDNSNASLRDFMLQDSIQMETFTERFGDMVAGWSFTISYKQHFSYYRCEVPSEGVISLEEGCKPVTVTEGLTVTEVSSGGSYTCATADATVQNSDLTYVVPVASGGTLNLPDINHIDSDGSTVPTPAQTVFTATPCTVASGIAYQRPILTGQVSSFRTNDDGWNIQNGGYDYTPPVFPVSYAQMDYSTLYPFLLLLNNNSFGHKFRFTGVTGGYHDPTDGNFYDVNGVLSNKATQFPDGLRIDHLSGSMWTITIQAAAVWNTAIDNAATFSEGGFNTGWRLPSFGDLHQLMDAQNNSWLGREPFALTTVFGGVLISSTTRKKSTTQVWAYQIQAGFIGSSSKLSSLSHIYIRTHLT